MTKEKTKLWGIILLGSLGLIFLMIIIGEAMTIGEKLHAHSVILEVLYYILIVIVIAAGIIYPIFGVFTAPVFSLNKLHDVDGKAKMKWCKRLVNNLIKNVDLTEEEKKEVKGYLNEEDLADDKLIEFFDRKIRPEVNAVIKDTATKVMIITAVSQNSMYDMIGMASANFSLVRRIVEICGFRPTTPQIIRLYIRVMSYTLLAGSMEDLNLEDILPAATESSLGKLGGIVLSSVAQGTMNALMTLRIAIITKNYLLNANVNQTRSELRRKSFIEAKNLMKEIAADSFDQKVSKPVKGVVRKTVQATANAAAAVSSKVTVDMEGPWIP